MIIGWKEINQQQCQLREHELAVLQETCHGELKHEKIECEDRQATSEFAGDDHLLACTLT